MITPQQEKWVKGYNDGYWLGRDDSFVARVIFNALEKTSTPYGRGIRRGFEIGREHGEKKRMNELKNLREKKQDRGKDLEL